MGSVPLEHTAMCVPGWQGGVAESPRGPRPFSLKIIGFGPHRAFQSHTYRVERRLSLPSR